MKVAFLILAHHQPEHLARLVHHISAEWNDIYIHIDHTSELEPFVSCIIPGDNPIFLLANQRIDYTWCGFSSVQAILSLLSAALGADQHYDRFCLLSGADFPIKPIDEIKDAFSGDTEFMRVDRRLTTDKNNSHVHIVRYYHFLDLKGARGAPPDGVIERELYRDIDLYHGATWWALSYECIGYIVDYLEQHPDYIEFHKYTFCPDEVFFHSIVKSSPFADRLSHDFEKEADLQSYYLLNEHGCHYIDWNANSVTLPKVLESNDFSHIKKSAMLFARKMDANDSSSLLSSIESLIDD